MSKLNVLRKSFEFRRVYANGKRYDGLALTALLLPNDLKEHRLGITVSRKYSPSAVKRNRAKRLLREAFRQNMELLNSLQKRYDWVLLPRKAMANSKLYTPLADFERIIEIIRAEEVEVRVPFISETSGEA